MKEQPAFSKYIITPSDKQPADLPEGFVMQKQLSRREQIELLQAEIDLLEASLLKEPSSSEVIETAKMAMVHPFYEIRNTIEQYKSLINTLKL